MTLLASLGWRDALCLAILAALAMLWIGCYLERRVRRFKARRRRSMLNRLNRGGYFRDIHSSYYRTHR